MKIRKVLHTRDNVDPLYASRKDSGRGLASLQWRWCIYATTRRLQKKGRRKVDFSHQKKYRQHRRHQNKKKTPEKCDEKQLYGLFKLQTSDIFHKKIWIWWRNENLERETESLLVAQNYAIITKYVKARIDKTQQNSWCGDRNETINYLKSECSKLAQKVYKTRYDWVGKLIHWELFKKLTFDHMNEWDMHNLESVLEKVTHKLLWYFEIQTDYLISARQLVLDRVNKKENAPNCGVCCSGWPQRKTERKREER